MKSVGSTVELQLTDCVDWNSIIFWWSFWNVCFKSFAKLNAYNVEFISIILVRDRFVEIYPLDDSQIDEPFIQINIRYCYNDVIIHHVIIYDSFRIQRYYRSNERSKLWIRSHHFENPEIFSQHKMHYKTC